MIVEYESKPTFVHRLDPRVKLVWMVCVILVSVAWTHPLYLAALGLSVVAFGLVAKTPWAKLKGVASFMLVVAAISASSRAPRTELRHPARPRKSFHLVPGWVPGVNPLIPVRVGGFVYGIAMSLKIFIVLLAVAIFGYATSPSEMVQVIARIPFIPYQVGFVLSTAWKFVPVVQVQMRTLMDAHRSRGVDFEQGTFPQRVKKTSAIVLPLFANSLTMADTMALAMEARAFGHSKRFTFIRPYTMSTGDWAVLIASLGVAIACTWMVTSRLGAI